MHTAHNSHTSHTDTRTRRSLCAGHRQGNLPADAKLTLTLHSRRGEDQLTHVVSLNAALPSEKSEEGGLYVLGTDKATYQLRAATLPKIVRVYPVCIVCVCVSCVCVCCVCGVHREPLCVSMCVCCLIAPDSSTIFYWTCGRWTASCSAHFCFHFEVSCRLRSCSRR